MLPSPRAFLKNEPSANSEWGTLEMSEEHNWRAWSIYNKINIIHVCILFNDLEHFY